MAEILGLGMTHYTGLRFDDGGMSIFLRRTLKGGDVPAGMKDPANWPEPMREEWADDMGAAAASVHRRRHWDAFTRMKDEIDAFAPDFVVMWGDDQYENFLEDIVPPFCAYIADEFVSTPYRQNPDRPDPPNAWGEPEDMAFVHRGHPEGAAWLVEKLSERGTDIPYAYRLRHDRGLAHAFINTLLFLDHARSGFAHPLVPFHVNCYGGELIRTRGGSRAPGEEDKRRDPSAPSARACFDLGRGIARVLADSPWRVALVASSSWSHAFLTAKNHWIYPDHTGDRKRLEELREGRFEVWRDLTHEEIEDAGQHEFRNWICLAGAMTELGADVEIVDYMESWVLNSNKCFAVMRP